MGGYTHPGWVLELFQDAAQWELVRAYFEYCLADYTDDVDCSSSTLHSRYAIMSYLADRLDHDTLVEVEGTVIHVAKLIGYASGRPWLREETGA